MTVCHMVNIGPNNSEWVWKSTSQTVWFGYWWKSFQYCSVNLKLLTNIIHMIEEELNFVLDNKLCLLLLNSYSGYIHGSLNILTVELVFLRSCLMLMSTDVSAMAMPRTVTQQASPIDASALRKVSLKDFMWVLCLCMGISKKWVGCWI